MGVRGVSGQEFRALVPSAMTHDPHHTPPAPDGWPDAAAPARAGPETREARDRQDQQATAPENRTREPPQVRRGGTRVRIDPASKRIVAQVVDENNEVVKQIPPEEQLKIASKFRDLYGVLFDRNA